MNPRSILLLQRLFWVLGWSILVLAAFTVAAEAFYFFKPMTVGGIPMPKRDFVFLNNSRVLFSSLGQAFFAFLVSSVFDMIFHKAPVKSQQTESFLTLACLGFVGEGILGLFSWAQLGVLMWPNFDLLTGLTYLLSIVPPLISFVYAITISVLFKHFSQMVAFESEVV